MAESLRVTMRRNLLAMKEFTRQAEEAEKVLDRVGDRAGAIGDRLGSGLQRALGVAGAPVSSSGIDGGGGERGGGERAPTLVDPSGRVILPRLDIPGGGPVLTGSGRSGGEQGGSNRGGFIASGGGGGVTVSSSSGTSAGGGDSNRGGFQAVEAAARNTAQAVRSLDTRSVPLLGSIDAGIRRLSDQFTRIADAGLLSRAD